MTYEEALAEGHKVGFGVCSDAAAMAGYCDTTIQHIIGAVSPKLVWDGAMKKKLTLLELGHLCITDPREVEALQWL